MFDRIARGFMTYSSSKRTRVTSFWMWLTMLLLPCGLVQGQNLAFNPGAMTVLAGDPTQTQGKSPNNFTGPASSLVMYHPQALAYDAQGNLYLGEQGGIVRVIAASGNAIPALGGIPVSAGQVYTVAGNNSSTLAPQCQPPAATDKYGDGCPAGQAILAAPTGIAIDPHGNVFIADGSHSLVRVVYAGGTLSGLPTQPVVGNIYAFAGTGVYGAPGPDGQPALNVQLSLPSSVNLDSAGDLLFTDRNAVRVVYNGGTLPGLPANAIKGDVYTLAGSLTNSCSADANHVSLPCGDSGSATAALLYGSSDVALDPSGNIYIVDQNDFRVRAIYVTGALPGVANPVSGNIYTVAGTGATGFGPMGGSATSAKFAHPKYLTFDGAGSLYISDYGNSVIEKVDPTGTISLVAGQLKTGLPPTLCAGKTDKYGDGCGANDAVFSNVNGLLLDPAGNLYISDLGNNLIRVVNTGQAALAYVGTIGFTTSQQTLTIYNSDSKPLQLNSIAVTGPFATAATGGSSDCTTSSLLPAGASCQIGVRFVPVQAGSFTGSILIGSNSTHAVNGQNAGMLTGVANQALSTTTLTVSPRFPAVAGVNQPVTLTALVSPQPGATVSATGTVTFLNGSQPIGSGAVGSDGTAPFTTSSLPAGSYVLTATYSGDTNFTASTSTAATLKVSSTPVAPVTLVAASSSVTAGKTVSLTATVAALAGMPTPTGTISFQQGVNPLGAPVSLNSSGIATFSTTSLAVGADSIIAVYSGDGTYSANASPAVIITVASGGQLSFMPGTITAVAGQFRTYGYTGDGSQATGAQVAPNSVAVDPVGNIYIADTRHNVVRVISSGLGNIPGVANPTKGNIYTVAGSSTGAPCSSLPCGDGGPATSALLKGPNAVKVDSFGNLYIADTNSYAIRKVDPTGKITTIAGTIFSSGYAGDGGPATAALLGTATGLFIASNGDLFIPDSDNNVVRKVDAQAGTISLFAGVPGSHGYSGDGGPATAAVLYAPYDVAGDSAGNIYISESQNGSVRKVDGHTGVITSYVNNATNLVCSGGRCQTPGFSGDGGPAASAQLNNPTGLAVDDAGDLFIADNYNNVIREVNVQSGIINSVIGSYPVGQKGCTSPCGDGGPATSAGLVFPQAATVDSQGNINVADEGNAEVRRVTAGTTALDFGSQNLGTTTVQTVSVTNSGNSPLTFSGLTLPSQFTQQPSGSTISPDCTATTVLAPGGQCAISLAFFPVATGPEPANSNLVIASDSSNAVSGNNTIALTGIGVGLGGTQPQTITFPALPSNILYGSAPLALSATTTAPNLPIIYQVTGPATVSTTAGGSVLTVTGVGSITVTAYQFGNSQFAEATPVSQTISVTGPTLTITADDKSRQLGSTNPALTYTATGFVNGDTIAVIKGSPIITTTADINSPFGSFPIVIAQGTLTAPAYYTLKFVNGTLTVTGNQVQSIVFGALPDVTYGVAPITLTGTSVAGAPPFANVPPQTGLQVQYNVQGPATITSNILTITGAGVVAVTAIQIGNSTYAAATPVTQSFRVAKAPLTVSASDITVIQGAPLPSFSTNYTITGFVNGDPTTVVSGSPVIKSNAPANPGVGKYPLSISQGSLIASNYSFAVFNSGTLNVINGTAQTIVFPPLPDRTYGAAPFTLNASASSGLGVSYSVSGPAALSGNILSILGAGTITVTVNQAGGQQGYGPAPAVSQSFTVAPAVLTITASDVTRMTNTVNPAFTGFSATGFVNGDSRSALSGSPAMTSVALPGSPIGDYPISISAGALAAVNYTFNLVSGTLHVVAGGPAADYSLSAAPASLVIPAGQLRQTTITLSPTNFYKGVVTLNCNKLPANVTCIFSPGGLSADGTGNPVTGTLTINTNSGSPVIASTSPSPDVPVMTASVFYPPLALTGFLVAFTRRRLGKYANVQRLTVLLALLIGAVGLAACGSSPGAASGSQIAQPGTSQVTLTAADSSASISHAIDLSITVQ